MSLFHPLPREKKDRSPIPQAASKRWEVIMNFPASVIIKKEKEKEKK